MENPELPKNGTIYNFDSIPDDDIKSTQEITNGKVEKEIPHIYPDKEKIKYVINNETKNSLAELSKEFFNKIGNILNKDNQEIQTPPYYLPSQKTYEDRVENTNNAIQAEAESPEGYTPPSDTTSDNDGNKSEKKKKRKPIGDTEIASN